jgi:hypothetical protein
MPRLDGDQAAEPMAEHKDWPDPQRTTGGEENNAKPANSVPIERPEFLPVCVGGQIGHQKPYQTENCEDPAIATILALAWAKISATKERCPRQHEAYDRKRNEGRMGEEGGNTAPAKDGEPEIGKGRHDGHDHQSGRGRHGLASNVRRPSLAWLNLPNGRTPLFLKITRSLTSRWLWLIADFA